MKFLKRSIYFLKPRDVIQKMGLLREILNGERGIRTPGTLAGSTVFKTAAIDHSAISPFYPFYTILYFSSWQLFYLNFFILFFFLPYLSKYIIFLYIYFF